MAPLVLGRQSLASWFGPLEQDWHWNLEKNSL